MSVMLDISVLLLTDFVHIQTYNINVYMDYHKFQ